MAGIAESWESGVMAHVTSSSHVRSSKLRDVTTVTNSGSSSLNEIELLLLCGYKWFSCGGMGSRESGGERLFPQGEGTND
ncbi:hypothetical protein TNCV_2191181 [Trichonephila clavipes]|nr:hypothetical protein TNCV_2191181 [Trichonephila clavipes]